MTGFAPDRLLTDTAWLQSLARRLVGDENAADLQQDVALAALARPQAAAHRSWLAAVAHHLAITRRRRRSAEQRRLLALPRAEPVPSPAELVATAELQQRAVAAVLALPPAYRDTMLLRFLQGLPLAATAAAMGVPEQTVRTRQKRALTMLRAQLVPPPREGRGGRVSLTSLVAWGALVNAKHVVVAVALALIALLVTVSLRPPAAAPPTAANATGAPARAAAAAGPAAVALPPDAAASARTAVAAVPPAPPASPDTAELTIELSWPDGGPAADCAIVCNSHAAAAQTVRRGTSDAAGRIVFADLAPGRYFVTTARYDNQFVELAAGAHERLAITLQRGFAVRGLVLDRAGAPVGGAEIWTAHVGVAPNWTFAAGHSDASGHFAIAGCRAGMVVGARAVPLGVSDTVMLDSESHGGSDPEQIVLHLDDRVCDVRVHVRDTGGRPVAGAWVALGDRMPGLVPDAAGHLTAKPPAALGATDAEGRFRVAQARTDSGRLLVTHRGFAPHREDFAFDGYVARELEVVLRAGGTLSGTVRDDAGEPVAGAEVETPYVEGLECAATTAADGTFVLHDLPLAPAEVSVAAPGLPKQTRSFTFASGEQQRWDIVLAKGLRIRGRLVDEAGAPLAAWWIGRAGADRRAKTDEQGHFVVAGCEATGNRLIVHDDWGFAPAILRFDDVLPSERERDFVVPAASMPSARVRGQCLAPDGSPLAEVTFDCHQGDWPVLLHNEMLRGGADGSFDFGALPPGHYTLAPRHQHYLFAAFELDLQPHEVRDLGLLRAAAPARLVVRLLGDEAAVRDTHVALASAAGRSDSSEIGSERTFAHLLPGTYRIVLRRGTDGAGRDAGEVDLRPGAELVREVAVH